uniref:CN hydrolase domain-containing protein n=1 Tax=Mesocestoides corti TaxID=53468 RepID=A0A5K3FKM7_MESCO
MRRKITISFKISVLLTGLFVLNFTMQLWRLNKVIGGFGEKSHVSASYQICRWPPQRVEDIQFVAGYNITLCVRLEASELMTRRQKTYPLTHLFQVSRTNLEVSFDDLAALPRTLWKRAKYPEVYRTYPQDVPLKQIVEAVKVGLTVTNMPEYNFPIHILQTSSTVCSRNTKHDLVIVVKSGILGWDDRMAFRAFMQRERSRCPQLNVGVVFSLGMPRIQGGRMFNREGNIISLSGISGDMLEQFDGKEDVVMERINREIEDFGDIVLADYEDTYFNLTWKTI